jgi:hypothetical protein
VNSYYVASGNGKACQQKTDKCFLPHVQTARRKHRFPSNRQKEDQFIAKNVYQNIVQHEDFRLKIA